MALPAADTERDRLVAAVRADGFALAGAAERFLSDREVILAAVGKQGKALHYAADMLKADREVALTAVGQNGEAIKYAAEALKGDREVALAAVGQDGNALRFAAAALQADREVVLAAVRQRGCALPSASAALRGDREVVLEAVRHHPEALQYAAPELQGDPEVQPSRAVRNPLAVPGTPAPVILVDAVAAAPAGGLEAQAHLVSGRKAVLRLPARATIGALARAAMRTFGFHTTFFVHVHLAGRAVSPFEWGALLAGPGAVAAAPGVADGEREAELSGGPAQKKARKEGEAEHGA